MVCIKLISCKVLGNVYNVLLYRHCEISELYTDYYFLIYYYYFISYVPIIFISKLYDSYFLTIRISYVVFLENLDKEDKEAHDEMGFEDFFDLGRKKLKIKTIMKGNYSLYISHFQALSDLFETFD